MIRRFALTLSIAILGCGTPSTGVDSGGLPLTGCSVSFAGDSTGTFQCAAGITGPASTGLRLQNIADPPTQPLSIQVLCSSSSAIAPGTYPLAMVGGNGGCTTLIQEFFADAAVGRTWRAEPGIGAMRVTITSVAMDGGSEIHGSLTATAPLYDSMHAMALPGHDINVTATF